MGRPDYTFGQFRETARCRDAQHGGGVCCAPQLIPRPLRPQECHDKFPARRDVKWLKG